MPDYDVIIVGGNVPALSAAAYLGKLAGQKCLILERQNYVGATAMCEEMNVPNHRFCPAATGEYYPHPKITADLELTKYGLGMVPANPSLTTVFGDGKYLSIYFDIDKTCQEIARFSQKDADAYRPLIEKWRKIGQFFGMATMNAPLSMQQFVSGMSINTEMQELMRDMLFATTRDILDRTFESDYTKAAFLTFCEGSDLAPSAAPFFFGVGRIMSPWGFVKGGLNQLANAFAKAAEANGATIKTNTTVEKILIKNNKAYGVRTTDGHEFTANLVIANTEPVTTFNKMVAPEWAPKEYMNSLGEFFHQDGGGATLNLALDKLPDFGIPEDRYQGFIGITTPGYDYLEDSFAAYQKREIPEKLCSMTYIPSFFEPGVFAPEGKHTLTGYAFPLPYTLKHGTWATRKEEMFEKWINSLDAFAPGLKKSVIGYNGFTPVELANRFGMTNGDIQHGTFRWISQLAFRPAIGYSDYRSPVKDLYFGGNSTWPTSGLSGVNGWNTANAVISDLKKDGKIH